LKTKGKVTNISSQANKENKENKENSNQNSVFVFKCEFPTEYKAAKEFEEINHK